MAGIYIHIPFCKQRCVYCAFFSSTRHTLRMQYVDALCKEIEERRLYIKGIIETVYFGGGTPSSLKEEELSKILTTIENNFNLSPKAEITIEANPDDLTPEYLAMLRTLPFNRISMGVQSFDNRLLSKLGRRHNAERARKAFVDARAAGFNNISIDLMFALPASTHDSWLYDLQSAIELHPEHISAYNLTYEEGTPLHSSLQQGKITPLTEEENLEQFNTLIDTLKKAGYRHYEISNFALPGYESRHNSSYWNDTPYLGCGAAAHSYNGTSRQWNIADIEQYINGINNNTPETEIEHLTTADSYNDTVLTRLRTAEGIPLAWCKSKFGEEMYEHLMRMASPHIARGTLKEREGHISLTHKGIFISDAIMRDLIYTD